ncbi:MAG: FAD-binding oxidoreductase [Gemmatimonadaceae bacterium]
MLNDFSHEIPPLRGSFRTDPDARAVYAESAGIAQLLPRAVAVPADVQDVEELVRWASAGDIPLIPRGSGSSMSGAAVGEGVIVDLSRLRALEPIDAAWERVRCQPGVRRRDVDQAARVAGLCFPVDPSSGAFATVGGMAATNAAGPRSMLKGAMRQWVTALECVFDGGERALIRRGAALPPGVGAIERWRRVESAVRHAAAEWPGSQVAKQSSGYGVHDFAATGDLVDLLVGSEGTLAVFTGVELALDPIPRETASVLASWNSLHGATRGAALAREAGAAACELLDRTFLDVARQGAPLAVPDDSEAVLLIGLEGNSGVRARAESLARALERAGAGSVAVGLDPASEESLWALRHAASPILARLDPHLKSMQLVEDGCVPAPRLAEYVEGVRRALDVNQLRGVIFGHAGDAHVHVNALVDVREDDWRERTRALVDAVVSLTAALGGTLAGEHGDGRLRTPYLSRTWSPEATALFATIKQAFDPRGILNPGVKVPAHALDVLRHNKYDPSLPPLPHKARAVLALVERERAYDASRLELLGEGG